MYEFILTMIGVWIFIYAPYSIGIHYAATKSKDICECIIVWCIGLVLWVLCSMALICLFKLGLLIQGNLL